MVVVISGPSGVGKDAVVAKLKEARSDLYFVVTATSRSVCAGSSFRSLPHNSPRVSRSSVFSGLTGSYLLVTLSLGSPMLASQHVIVTSEANRQQFRMQWNKSERMQAIYWSQICCHTPDAILDLFVQMRQKCHVSRVAAASLVQSVAVSRVHT